jgi:hypothetical protein
MDKQTAQSIAALLIGAGSKLPRNVKVTISELERLIALHHVVDAWWDDYPSLLKTAVCYSVRDALKDKIGQQYLDLIKENLPEETLHLHFLRASLTSDLEYGFGNRLTALEALVEAVSKIKQED